MTAHAGETVRDSGYYRCERCNQQLLVQQGQLLPACPQCGNRTFDSRSTEAREPAAR